MNFPNDEQRIGIYGQNGSGKTVAALWNLEKRSWSNANAARPMPWTIIDFKRDRTIAQIPRLEELDVNASPPKHPGLYVIRPMPHETDEIEEYMFKMWENQRHGALFDEGYMIPRMSKAFKALMTQGRSLRLPAIVLSQRPAYLSPWMMSEMNFHQVFFLATPADKERMREWIPGYDGSLEKNYHSIYYDQDRHETTYLKPVPDEDEILNRFDMKMARRFHLFKGITHNVTRKRVRGA